MVTRAWYGSAGVRPVRNFAIELAAAESELRFNACREISYSVSALRTT
jgi:hypothetical protein